MPESLASLRAKALNPTRSSKWGGTVAATVPKPVKPEPAAAPETKPAASVEDLLAALQAAMEEEFFQYFGELVSEWNPCFSTDGRARYTWDEEIGAHDVEVCLLCISSVLHRAASGFHLAWSVVTCG